MKADLTALADRLETSPTGGCHVVTGFDGFVDEMISLVGERQSLTSFTPVPDIATFGKLVSAAAGHSSLREIVVTDVHPGGCAVNLADGLASLGVRVDCFATLGEPVHPAFEEIGAKCAGFYSWGREPGRTLAFEFADGKLMFSAVLQLAEFTPTSVQAHLLDGSYQAACRAAQVIALTDWTLYPHMTGVWKLLQREVYSNVLHRPHFFIDLVDPSSRSSDDILGMVLSLAGFESHGRLTLGLNGNEANILSRLLGLDTVRPEGTADETLAQATALREKLKIARVIIHRIAFAVCSDEEGGFTQAGPYCPTPKKSTGAGDRFNAGFCLGLSLSLPGPDCLALGCAASGFFVRNAASANQAQLVQFLREWADNAGTK